MDRPVTFHDPGVPEPAVPEPAAETVEVCSATVPSVIDTVAAPIGPAAPVTVPDSDP